MNCKFFQSVLRCYMSWNTIKFKFGSEVARGTDWNTLVGWKKWIKIVLFCTSQHLLTIFLYSVYLYIYYQYFFIMYTYTFKRNQTIYILAATPPPPFCLNKFINISIHKLLYIKIVSY